MARSRPQSKPRSTAGDNPPEPPVQRETMHRPATTTRTLGLLAVLLLCGGVLFLLPHITHAAGVNAGLTPGVSDALGLGTEDVRVTVAKIIRAFMGLLGIVAVVIILYGGFLWMTSAGNEEQVDKARKVITSGVIGLAIILSAVAITQFAIGVLTGEGFGGGVGRGGRSGSGAGAGSGSGFGSGFGSGGVGGAGGVFSIPFSGSLGSGIVQSHVPRRGDTNVPRNIRIMVTFREPMQIASFVRGYDDGGTADDLSDDTAPATPVLNTDVVKIYATTAGEAAALGSEQVRVTFTADGRTFVFVPPLLGSPDADTSYTIKITNAARTAAGAGAFAGAFSAGYAWDFTTGVFSDTTAPRIRGMIPTSGSEQPRNTLIQLTFDEPMDPTTLSGILPGFTNVSVASGGTAVAGNAELLNEYRTLEFVPADRCGTNACGASMYCLPPSASITFRIRAASLSDTPPLADPTVVPADGATDMAGNSLDGNGDGTASGPATDSWQGSLRTTAALDTTAPVIEQVTPDMNAGGVAPDAAVTVRFSKPMSLRSISAQSMPLTAYPEPSEPTCYAWSSRTLTAALEETDQAADKTEAVMRHCLFASNTAYVPEVTSAVQDIRQNCYAPSATTPAMGRCSEGSAYCCNGLPSTGPCVVNAGSLTPSR